MALKLQGSLRHMPLQKTGESVMYLPLHQMCSCKLLLPVREQRRLTVALGFYAYLVTLIALSPIGA